jgi:hypothetical protein
VGQTTSAGIGFSSSVDTDAAVAEALASALASGDAPPVAAIVYATVAYDQTRVPAAIHKRLPGVAIVGASSPGVSVNGRALETTRCLAIAVLRSSTVKVRAGVVEKISAEPFARGRDLGHQLGPPPAQHGVTFLWYDPLTGANVDDLLRGLGESGFPAVFGGAAGQPWGPMVRTFQYFGDRALSDGAVALTLDGLDIVSDTTHGTDPTGLELTVTKVHDHVVEEIDGRPALDVWCEHLGLEAIRDVENTVSWALGIKPPPGATYEGLFTRTPFAIDPEKRTFTLQAPIPVGSKVQVCVRTKEAVFDRALAMGRRVRDRLDGRKPVLALSFECAARPSPFLGPELASREVVELQGLIGNEIPWLGMYAWGELVPLVGRSEFHNYTFPLCVLCEAE